jgi:steroid delta-isomerase-like uncharacterized protein
MSEQHKELARRFLRAFATGDVATLEQIVSADLIDHNSPPGANPGRQGLLDAVAMFRTGFPDLDLSIEQAMAEGDMVAICGSVAGTHLGMMMGVPATGKRASFAFMDMYRIADGRIVETWHVEDVAGMFSQLGLMGS